MATFSVNQVKQLYVANAVNRTSGNKVASTDSAGTIRAVGNDGYLYFEYKGADNLMRSDLIDVENILWAKSTNASKMATPLRKVLVTVDSDALSSGAPLAGKDYIMRIVLRNYVGMSDEDLYFKYGMVHTTSSMKIDTFYTTLASSLTKNFSREIVPLLNFTAVRTVKLTTNTGVTAFLYKPTSGTATIQFVVDATTESVTKTSGAYTINLISTKKKLGDAKRVLAASSYAEELCLLGEDSTTLKAEAAAVSLATSSSAKVNAMVISEIAQPWILGKKAQVPVYFDIQSVGVEDSNGIEVNWVNTVEVDSPPKINNGKKIADLEYFCMAERGDFYKGMGYPNNIETTYLVNPANAYHTLTIHYAYVGGGEGPQKSERDIVIVSSDKSALNNLISDVKTISGLTIAAL